jgi:hypothetical protein
VIPFAEIDWPTVATAAGGAFTVVTGVIGGAGKFLLDHLSKQRDIQRAHEADMLKRVETLADQNREAVAKVAADFEQTARDLTRESREDGRKMTQTLLTIQRETVGAVGSLTQRVGELGTAISALQQEMHRKADRDPAK